ncbi:hypothetical protein CENSYa_0896 [Cenarchaeum symbiosum A]|uniref:Uncharacterized protein n=1 Tax=Cenarchaeum symbiosum (strain A) TaxID=414004 RepID=A0RW11_CENSY|nr:hypothetical protein CENSYa_0896 [Cenarchaeum symbiosum A]
MISRTTRKTTYKAAAIGFAAVFALMMTPTGVSGTPEGVQYYGMAELVHKSADGQTLATQTVHNTVLNTGEDIMRDAIFDSIQNNQRPSVICITDVLEAEITETVSDSALTPATAFATPSESTCIGANVNTETQGQGILTATFTGGTHLVGLATIESIVICNTDGTTPVPEDATGLNCDTVGTAFSAVKVSSTQVASGDTVDVTYTFDLQSDTT